MGLRIATNTQSLAAQRNLGINGQNQKGSLEKLASGSRIVRSADDAAGLAISEHMKGQIRSIRQGTRNANDGISMIQVAEGAMNETSNILIRFRELSMQAASDTIGDVERGFIDKEVQQLKQEVDRIAQSTEFAGTKLLTGEGNSLDIQIGVHNRPDQDRFVFDPKKTNSTLSNLGLSSIATLSKGDAQNNLEKIDMAIKTLAENRSELGAMQNRLVSVVNNAQIYEENMSAANSRIRDLDVASETSELTKNNILTQATVSVLSQANQNPFAALKLIG
ncbi:MAG: flagellin FliC [Bdellovibrionales bacterium]|nr:flagellin FliC [Bdellovibrionales bacterium]